MTTDKTTTARIINMTAEGHLIYADDETGMAAALTLNGLRIAHAADITIGVHPYATATAWTSTALLPTVSLTMFTSTDALIVDDWCDWCDDVFARYAEHSSEESIVSSAQQTGAITEARYLDEVNAAE